MVKLRAPEECDVDRIFLWENDPGFFEVLPYSAPLSRLQVWEYIKNYDADPFSSKELRQLINDGATGETVGYVDMFEFDPVNNRAGVGIYIDEDYRRKGYGTAALSEVERYVRDTLGLHQLWSIIAIDNEASRALFVRAGFKACGRLRSWLRRRSQYTDALFMQKLFA